MNPKHAERREARLLRRRYGLPIKQIAQQLGVSPSSVQLWTREIQITAEQRARNMRRSRTAFSETWRRMHREQRAAYQEEGRVAARAGDPLHLAGCMLYWAEGLKRRGAVRITNSDVHLLTFFRRFLTTCFDIEPHELTLSLHVYTGNGLSIPQIEAFWLNALELPRSCLRKHSIDAFPTSSSGKKKNKLPYGVCTLTLYSTRITQHIYGAIQEYAGFKEPCWLDGPPIKRRTRKKRSAATPPHQRLTRSAGAPSAAHDRASTANRSRKKSSM